MEDAWFFCNDKEWLESANLLAQAGQCIIELRLMSLSNKMERLLMEIRSAERRRADVSDLVEEYTIAMKEKAQLSTKQGRLEFIDSMLAKDYAHYKLRKSIPVEEVLPL